MHDRQVVAEFVSIRPAADFYQTGVAPVGKAEIVIYPGLTVIRIALANRGVMPPIIHAGE